MKLSDHFSLNEFTFTRNGKEYIQKNEEFAKEHIDVLKELCTKILEPIRAYVVKNYNKKSVTISSGMRCPELNKKIGGSSTSQHSHCEAADLIITNNINELALIAKDIVEGKIEGLDLNSIAQLILERKWNTSVKAWGFWLHVSLLTPRFIEYRKSKNGNTKGKEFLISLDGKSYIEFNDTNINKYKAI